MAGNFARGTSRYLDSYEENLKGFAVPHVIQYRGTVNQQLMGDAFRLLCQFHPVLRAHIDHDERGDLVHISPDHYPEFIVLKGGKDELWRAAYEAVYVTRTLAQLILVCDGHEGFVAFRSDHSIADGTADRAMLGELWRLYTALATGMPVPDIPELSLPMAPSLLFYRLEGIGFRASLDLADPPGSLAVSPAVEQLIRLGEESTARLVNWSRESETSVHGLVSGAILVALREEGAESGGPLPMVCLSPVNLRRYATPPVGATETTNFAAHHRAVVRVARDADPTSVGRDVKAQLDASLRDGGLDINPVRSPPPPVDTGVEQRFATTSVSNNGIVPIPDHPDDMEIVDFLLPAYPKTVLYPTHSVYTFDGKLSVRIVYPSDLFNRTEITSLVRRTTELLTR